MKAMSPPSSNNLRRGFVLAAMLGLLASATSVVTNAANLVLTGATTASCTYSQATMDAAGNLNVTTGTSCGLVPPAPDALALATPTPTTVVVNGTVGISVTRSNPTATGGVSGTVTATGGCLVSNGGAFIFGTTSTTPQPLTITAPAAATTCTISLAATTPASLGTPNTFNLSVTASAPLPFDILAFSSASATVASGGSTAFNVTRATTNYSGASATLAASGGCSLSSGAASFPTNSTTPIPITVTAPVGPTTCVVTLTPGTNAASGTPSSFTMTVSAPVSTTPGCSTSANSTLDVRTTGRSLVVLGGGQSAAVKFYVPGDGKLGGTLSTAEYIGATLPPDIQVNISQCPGDFNVVAEACGSYATGQSSTTTYNVGSGPFWNCVVDSSKTWYLNVRFPSCTGSCGAFIDRM